MGATKISTDIFVKFQSQAKSVFTSFPRSIVSIVTSYQVPENLMNQK